MHGRMCLCRMQIDKKISICLFSAALLCGIMGSGKQRRVPRCVKDSPHRADMLLLLRESRKDDTVKKLKELHLDVFCRAVMYVLTEYLGMEKKFCLMEPDKGAGERLLDIIIEGGNFGKFNVKRISEKNKKRSLLGKYIAANIKNIRFIGDYTNEVLWGPYFMLYNWIWRHTR